MPSGYCRLAALVALSLLLAGCSKNPASPGTQAVTRVELTSSQTVVSSTLEATGHNELVDALSTPGLSDVLGSAAPALLPAVRVAGMPREGTRMFASRNPRSSRRATSPVLPTGSYRIVDSTTFVRYSDVPANGLFVIKKAYRFHAAAADSDSVRVADVTYHQAGSDRVLQSFQLDAYLTHRASDEAPAASRHVGRIIFSSLYNGLGLVTHVDLAASVTDVVSWDVTLDADYLHGVYTMATMSINHLLGNAQVDSRLVLHGAGNPITGNYSLSTLDAQLKVAAQGIQWENNLAFDQIYLNPAESSLDTARVAGNYKKNGVVVATLDGTLKLPVPPATCPPVYVTLVSTSERFLICELFPDFAQSPVTAVLPGSLGGHGSVLPWAGRVAPRE